MEEYTKSVKGHKGFAKKYKVLGETKQMKVPSLVYDKIKYMIWLLDKVAMNENIDKSYTLLDGLISVLENRLKYLLGSNSL